MATLIEFIPLILFFICFKMVDIFWATGVLIVTYPITMLLPWLLHKKKPTTLSIGLFGVLVVMGTMTIIFRDDLFIKWKVTVIYALMSLALLLSKPLFNKNLFKTMFATAFENAPVPEPIWNRLNYLTSAFLALLAVTNIVVAYQFSQEVWVNFKVFGIMAIIFVYLIAIALYLSRYLPEEQDEKNN